MKKVEYVSEISLQNVTAYLVEDTVIFFKSIGKIGRVATVASDDGVFEICFAFDKSMKRTNIITYRHLNSKNEEQTFFVVSGDFASEILMRIVLQMQIDDASNRNQMPIKVAGDLLEELKIISFNQLMDEFLSAIL